MAREFNPVFDEQDFVNLPKYSMYLKLMIDGATSRPFSADTLALVNYTDTYKNEIIFASRKKYANNRVGVENEILEGANIVKNFEQKKLFY